MLLILYFVINTLITLFVLRNRKEFDDITRKNRVLSKGIWLMPLIGFPYVLLLSVIGLLIGTAITFACVIAAFKMILDDR